MSIQEVDQISITILMDNSTDLLLKNSTHATRAPLTMNEKFVLPPPIAEHGFSALVNVVKYEKNSYTKNNNNIFLFDTGVSENGVLHNIDVFGINFDQIKGIILSHGHFDHFTGLVNIIKTMTFRQPTAILNLFIHPDAFLKRWVIFPDGRRAKMPFLDEKNLEKMGVQIHKNTGVRLLPNDKFPWLLITGEIPRATNYERGFPIQYTENAHDNEKKVNQINKIYAVIEGFHLPEDGGIYEQAIEPTIKELEKADPEYIVPCHCTGWKATNRIIETFPEKFMQSSVGTTFKF